MLVTTKLLFSLLYISIFICPTFAMNKLYQEIEEEKGSLSIEMSSLYSEHLDNLTSITNNPHQLKITHIASLDESVTDEENQTNKTESGSTRENNSFDSDLLGNQEINFSTPLLEWYAKKSATCWDFLYSWLGDLESIANAAETALTVSTQFISNVNISICVIEATMIADTLHKLYSLSQKIAPIRAKQARMYEAQNKLNKLRNQDPNHQLLINGKPVFENEEFYASNSSACLYNYCAIYRNIAWDQVGVLAILCRIFSNSIIAFSLATNINTSKKYLFIATILRIGGTFCHLYAKKLSKNTKDIEEKAINAATYVEYHKRLKTIAVNPINNDHV